MTKQTETTITTRITTKVETREVPTVCSYPKKEPNAYGGYRLRCDWPNCQCGKR